MASQLELAQQRLENLRQQRLELVQRRKELEKPAGAEKVPEIPAGATTAQIKDVQRWLMSRGYYGAVPKGVDPIDGSAQGATAAALAKANADLRSRSGDVRDYETRKSAIDDKVSAIDDNIKIAEKDTQGATWGGWAGNTAENYAPKVLGTALGFGENMALKRGVDTMAAARANNLNSIAGDLKNIDYRSPAALAQAEGRVIAARPYMPPANPALNALARGGGTVGRLAMYGALPAIEGIEYGQYNRLANDPAASEQQRANNQMIANGLLTSAGVGGLTGTAAAFLPNFPDTGQAQAQIRTAEAMLRDRQGGTLPGPINPQGFTPAPMPPTAVGVQNALGAPQAIAGTPISPAANALLAPPIQAAAAPQPAPQLVAPPGAPLPPEAIPPSGDEIASLQARMQASSDPSEVEALKGRISELQGQIDAQAARTAASRERGGITNAATWGDKRLAAAPDSTVLARAQAINTGVDPADARNVLATENARLSRLSPAELKLAAENAGIATEGLSAGSLLTKIMKARTIGLPAALAAGASAGALALGAGSNPADAAPQGREEGTAHYIARRAYPYLTEGANAASYLAPTVGPARVAADALNAGVDVYNAATAPSNESAIPQDTAPRSLSSNLASGVQYDRSNVPPLPDLTTVNPALAADLRAEHDRQAQTLAAARVEDLRQRQEATLGPAPASSFDAALERLQQALIAHRMISTPDNALLRR